MIHCTSLFVVAPSITDNANAPLHMLKHNSLSKFVLNKRKGNGKRKKMSQTILSKTETIFNVFNSVKYILLNLLLKKQNKLIEMNINLHIYFPIYHHSFMHTQPPWIDKTPMLNFPWAFTIIKTSLAKGTKSLWSFWAIFQSNFCPNVLEMQKEKKGNDKIIWNQKLLVFVKCVNYYLLEW